MLCPRACSANRRAGQTGTCGADDTLVVARAALHFWEEPPISGTRGSGTVFFSNCPLHCIYCQNYPIAQGQAGKAITVERLAQIYLELEAQGAHNINLVTPTHYVPQILDALDLARTRGLELPIVYNTSGYEQPVTIDMLAGTVDIYLTDFKYANPVLAARYSNAPDYPAAALAALQAMFKQVGSYTLGDDGLLRRGIIVRHLMLPGQLADSKAIVRALFERYGNAVCYSLMNQYTPMPQLATAEEDGGCRYPELRATVSEDEYSELVDYALDLGITNSFMQEGGTAEESFIPPFDLTGVQPLNPS
jgi:putative pyruvate formate lyase activating enzyme